MGFIRMERRLHQLVFVDCNYKKMGRTRGKLPPCLSDNGNSKPFMIVNNYWEGYSVVNVHCKDNP